jgi:uncharacterized membrane protein YcaP (DUF421 family)
MQNSRFVIAPPQGSPANVDEEKAKVKGPVTPLPPPAGVPATTKLFSGDRVRAWSRVGCCRFTPLLTNREDLASTHSDDGRIDEKTRCPPLEASRASRCGMSSQSFQDERVCIMWSIAVPTGELVLRAVVVYAFLLALLRFTGKRQVGQLAPFDLVLLLVLSNAVQNSINAGDNSLVGGLISAATLVGLNFLVGLATYRNKKLEAIIEGHPEVLIHNGRIFENVMARAQLTHHELDAALRRGGCACVDEVHLAILENNGSISVIPHHQQIRASGSKSTV